MKRILLFLIVIGILTAGQVFAQENKLERYNNLSIYQTQNNEISLYKFSLYTSLTRGTWFLQNVFDNFYADDEFRQTGYYTLTTIGKYITKKISIRCQFEKSKNNPTQYYIGVGIDF